MQDFLKLLNEELNGAFSGKSLRLKHAMKIMRTKNCMKEGGKL